MAAALGDPGSGRERNSKAELKALPESEEPTGPAFNISE